ncbi:hypothetical protein B0H10DRAFT_1943674 [Mycena sp. CBHHK59/15]|nr:hypothetical protein B0H10DRAFT_1943674 [Mycena sp. CBHHK59/15]
MVDIQDTQLLKQLPCHQVVTVLADLFEPVFSKSFATTEADHSANGSQDNNAWSRPTKASGKASLSKLPLDTKSDREDEIETDFTGQKFDRSAGSLNETYIKYLEDQLTAEQEKNRDLEERVATQNTDLLMEPLTESEIGPPDTGLDEYCIVESQGVNSPTHELSEVLNIDASPKADQRFSDSRLRRLESSGDGAIILDNHEADHLEILQPPKNHIHASIQGCRDFLEFGLRLRGPTGLAPVAGVARDRPSSHGTSIFKHCTLRANTAHSPKPSTFAAKAAH